MNSPEDLHQKILRHYELAIPLVSFVLGSTPITSIALPKGFFESELRVSEARNLKQLSPSSINIKAKNWNGSFTALSIESIRWQLERGALSFECCSPVPVVDAKRKFGNWSPASEPYRIRYAHLIITAHGLASRSMQREATVALCATMIEDHEIRACIVLDGPAIVLWVPFCDEPLAEDIYTWLQEVVQRTIQRLPNVFEAERDWQPDRIRVSWGFGIPGHGVTLPYALRANRAYTMATPITQAELSTLSWNSFDVNNSAERLYRGVFESEIARIGDQTSSALKRSLLRRNPELLQKKQTPLEDSEIVRVCLRILADGRARSIDEIRARAAILDLWPASSPTWSFQASLSSYLDRCQREHRAPLLLETAEHQVRVARFGDDLPLIDRDHRPSQERLSEAATSISLDTLFSHYSMFEIASSLGFNSLIPANNAETELILDKCLGPLSYRVALTCLAPDARPSLADAHRLVNLKDAYGANYAILVAAKFSKTDQRLIEHIVREGIALCTYAEAIAISQLRPKHGDLRSFFEPGRVNERIKRLRWLRRHSEEKKAEVICEGLVRVGWAAQQEAARYIHSGDLPALTLNAARLLVDEWLIENGSLYQCTTDDIKNAFLYLTNARVQQAAWVTEEHLAIAILQAPAMIETRPPDYTTDNAAS